MICNNAFLYAFGSCDNPSLIKSLFVKVGCKIASYGESYFSSQGDIYYVNDGDKVAFTSSGSTLGRMLTQYGTNIMTIVNDGISWDDVYNRGDIIDGYVATPVTKTQLTEVHLCSQDIVWPVYATTQCAKAAIAMSRISILMQYYGGVVGKGISAWVIRPVSLSGKETFIVDSVAGKDYCEPLLRFKTREQAISFMLSNRQLLCDYFMWGI